MSVRACRGAVRGAALLFDATACAIPTDAAVFALIVDVKDDAAARFYRHHGFQAFSGKAARLFLPGDGAEGGGELVEPGAPDAEVKPH
jgi:hypothetical protein